MSWGGETPPWVHALAARCKRSSQAAVARELGVSAALVNQVLKGVYRGNIDRVRDLVEGAFMGAIVGCPVLGDIPLNRCISEQERPFSTANPTRVRLYRACRDGCPHSRVKE